MNSNKRTSRVKNRILLAIIIAFLIAIIGATYSNFISMGNVRTTADIAKWHVILGDEDISSQTKTLQVAVTDAEENENITAGKIAPGKTVIAQFDIDPSGSQVELEYLLDIKIDEVNGFEDSELSVEKVTYLLNGQGNEIDAELDQLTGVYYNSESLYNVLANKKVTYKVYITWNAIDTEERNAADSNRGANLANAIIPIDVTARQYIGESTIVAQNETIEDAVANTANGGVIKLNSNIDYTEIPEYSANSNNQIMLPDNSTLDLNGKTVTSYNASAVIAGNNITIKNGTFQGVIGSDPRSYICIWNYYGETPSENITLDNVVANGGINAYNVNNLVLKNVTSTADKYYAVFGNPATTITIDSGTYSCTSDSTALLAYYKSSNPTDGFIVNGGTFITNGKPFSLHSKNASYTQPIVRGGVFDIDITADNVNGRITLEEGYSISQRQDGMWEVTKDI